MPLVILGVVVVAAIAAPILAPYGPLERTADATGALNRLAPPSWDHPFGTTNLGRDVFSQVIWGARRSLTIGVCAALATVAIGINVGLLAGYFRGPVDNLLMRLTDVAYAIPFLPFAIVLVGIFGRSDVVLVVAIATLFWRTTARIVRAQVLSLRERPFIRSARAVGAAPLRIVYLHLLPNVVSMALLYAVLLVAEAIVAEATLSFLGLAPADSLSWGTVMFDAFTSGRLNTSWWWTFFPGLAIMLTVFAVSLCGRAIETRQLREVGA
ncbi:Oligopeptide transport system permease protein OppC [Euzebya pacifica]|uniref:Oligopeptide transport system permease protein OppC n=1 Tax=Euzebya pacifica TaxID=1608957 RepID=A0A346Y172_9ACTN|nr:ABC transporter permease [Euzebya pacifica]AXV08219.1 Oligopeptide transport system permease protein OppC [Euzebya pacifica]